MQEAVGGRCGAWDKSTDSQGTRDARVRGYLYFPLPFYKNKTCGPGTWMGLSLARVDPCSPRDTSIPDTARSTASAGLWFPCGKTSPL